MLRQPVGDDLGVDLHPLDVGFDESDGLVDALIAQDVHVLVAKRHQLPMTSRSRLAFTSLGRIDQNISDVTCSNWICVLYVSETWRKKLTIVEPE